MIDARRSFALIAAGALALGCSKNKEADGESASSGKVTEASGGEATPASRASIVLPSNEPRYLNPLLELRFNRANMLIFEGLVGLDTSLEPVPRLAEKWTVSEDGSSITFALRKGVKWSDGQAFDSADVAFTFEALRALEDESTLWGSFMNDVEAVETPDPHTVVVRYRQAYAPALITWTMGIIPEHLFKGQPMEAAEANQKPVGTGPYKLQRWDVGKRMVLVANDKWWYGDPRIGTVQLNLDGKNQLAALRAGDLDFAEIPDTSEWVTRAQHPEFRDRYQVTTSAGPLLRMIAWNTQRGHFKDPRVRQALTYALNRRRVIEDLLLGQGQLVSAPMFPTMFGLDRSIAAHGYDLERAKALLDEAGLKAGASGHRFELTLLALENQKTPINEEMLAAYERDLSRELGVGFRVEYLAFPEWKKRVTETRNFDAAYFGWLPEIPDPDPYNLLHSSQVEKGRQNFAGYKSADADALLEEARRTTDREKRGALYQKLHAVLHNDMPYTVTYAPFRHYAWNRRVRGVSPEDIGEFARFPGLATWWVEQK